MSKLKDRYYPTRLQRLIWLVVLIRIGPSIYRTIHSYNQATAAISREEASAVYNPRSIIKVRDMGQVYDTPYPTKKLLDVLVLILDTCHADAFSSQMRGLNASGRPNTRARGISLVNEVADKAPDSFVLGSSQGNESSREDAPYRLPEEKQGHRAFRYALLRGLDGEAPTYDRIFYVEELSAYVSQQAYEVTHGRQTPVLNSAHGANFPIARAIEPPSPANAQQAANLLQQGEQAKRKGQLPQARKALARAEQLDPKKQVTRVLNDEVSADISYQDAPNAQRDMFAAASKLLKESNYKVPTDPWAPSPMVIAFVDINTAGGSPEREGLHDALVSRLSQSLQGTKRVQVVDRHVIAAVLREQRLSMTDLSDPATRLRVGRILGARLVGMVNVASLDKDKYSVDIHLIDTLIDAKRVEFAINLSEPLSGYAKVLAVADKTANDILSQVEKEYPLRGKIAMLNGDHVVLDFGATAGATIGMRMNAVVEEPIKVNGEVIAMTLTRVGSAEITEVQPKASSAKVLDHKVTLTAGTKVIEAANPAAASTRTVTSPSPSP